MFRIHGHVHGIMQMIDEGRSYTEIVQQITAVKSVLESTIRVIFDDLVEHCMASKNSRQGVAQSVLELKQVSQQAIEFCKIYM